MLLRPDRKIKQNAPKIVGAAAEGRTTAGAVWGVWTETGLLWGSCALAGGAGELLHVGENRLYDMPTTSPSASSCSCTYIQEWNETCWEHGL